MNVETATRSIRFSEGESTDKLVEEKDAAALRLNAILPHSNASWMLEFENGYASRQADG